MRKLLNRIGSKPKSPAIIPSIQDVVSSRSHAVTLTDLVTLGDVANQRRDWKEAQLKYQMALAIDGTLGPIWVQLGHALKEQGFVVDSENAYRKALSLMPTDSDAHLQLGHCLKVQGRYAEALVAYEGALKHDSTCQSAWAEISTLKGAQRETSSLVEENPEPSNLVTAVEASNRNRRSVVFDALSGLGDASQQVLASRVHDTKTKLIAFYLPQYHRVPENSEWWSPGFTEWTNVARGRPNFKGHIQPKIPRELGFYDLTHPRTLREQVSMAKGYGVHAFCFYHYWFSGRRILERPLIQFMDSDIDFNFMICWANENWTRTWDGDEKHVLLKQGYGADDAVNFLHSVAHILRDPRYVRVEGKPLLLVYRPRDIPEPATWFATWRQLAEQIGLPGLHISCVDFYDVFNPGEFGADSLVEFPPHKFNGPQNHPSVFPDLINPDFSGGMVDYRKIMRQSIAKERPQFPYFRGIIPSWDNTARRQNHPLIVVNSNPKDYEDWLNYLRAYTRESDGTPYVFVNAWNEWGEGCFLEPDMQHGTAYLEATLRTAMHAATDTTAVMKASLLAALD